MSCHNYTIQNQEKLLKAFETYEKTGAKIVDLQYEDSYYMDDGWRVKYRLIEQNRTGKSETVLEDVVLNWKLEYE